VPTKPSSKRKRSTRKPRPAPARVAYSIPEWAKMLGVVRQTVWRQIKAGQLRTTRVGDREMVLASELVRLNLIDESA
jgi:excisionase family DNA binding protein